MKRCNDCGESKPLDEFHRNVRKKDGHNLICKACANARTRGWRKAHPERAEKNRADTRRWNEENPDYRRRQMLQSKYGIAPEQYDALLSVQDGRCACCGTNEAGGQWGTFHVDHCHDTGRIRGLLCNRCNTAIGLFGDTVEGVDMAAAYMRRDPESLWWLIQSDEHLTRYG